jgi:hypothetical protein
MTKLTAFFWPLPAWAILGATASVLAQTAPIGPGVCAVKFEVQAQRLRNLEGSQLANLQNHISGKAADKLRDQFVNWNFAARDQIYPCLKIWIEEEKTMALDICMQFWPDPTGPAGKEWVGEFFKPGEYENLGYWPAEDPLREAILLRLEKNILERSRADIESLLENYLPLAAVVSRFSPAPLNLGKELHVLLPLDQNKYRRLAISEFRLECSSAVGIVQLHSTGAGRFSPYPPPPAFSALDAVHKKWEKDDIQQHRRELRNLTAERIYLEHENYCGTCPGNTLTPQVAPP